MSGQSNFFANGFGGILKSNSTNNNEQTQNSNAANDKVSAALKLFDKGNKKNAIFDNLNFGNSNLIKKLKLSEIEVCEQVRTNFNDEALEDLAQSIKQNGLIQPITVHKLPSNQYRLLCGERRYRACKLAGIDEITAFVVDDPKDHATVTIRQLIENVVRVDLSPVELADAIAQLKKEGVSSEQIQHFINLKRTQYYEILSIDKFLSPEEKAFFVEYPLNFFNRFIKLKKADFKLGEKLFKKAKELNLTKEDVFVLLSKAEAKVFHLKVEDVPVQTPESTPKEERDEEKKSISVNFEKLNKEIEGIGDSFKAYVDSHPDIKPSTIIAQAIELYLLQNPN